MKINIPYLVHKPLKLLGEASYSVYLLHPIVFMAVGFAISIFNEYLFELPLVSRLLISVVVTLVVSYITYNYFEKYFVRLSRSKKSKVNN